MNNYTISEFLTQNDWADAQQHPLPQDCSTRRYVRLVAGNQTCLLMVDPAPHHSLPAFLHVAGLLRDRGFRAPQVYGTDGTHLALIEDFGDLTYTRQLAQGVKIKDLYETAVDLLIALRNRFSPETLPNLPAFMQESYLKELDIFSQWYYPYVMGHPLPEKALLDLKALVADTWDDLSVPQGIFLKDMHIDNLITLKGTGPIETCGLLDFQDARIGPAIYDLASLLQDSRSPIDNQLMSQMKVRYFAALPHLDTIGEEEAYHVTGAQRNIKNLGIFVRMFQRNNQPRYLQFIPRTLENLQSNLSHPTLYHLKAWWDQWIPHNNFPHDFLTGGRCNDY